MEEILTNLPEIGDHLSSRYFETFQTMVVDQSIQYVLHYLLLLAVIVASRRIQCQIEDRFDAVVLPMVGTAHSCAYCRWLYFLVWCWNYIPKHHKKVVSQILSDSMFLWSLSSICRVVKSASC